MDSPGQTYELISNGRAIRCNKCGRVSFNRNDVELRYCGNCKLFHEQQGELFPASKAVDTTYQE